MPAYASGLDIGLTDDELVAVYQAYAEHGLRAAKLKGGLDVERDRHRLTLVRDVLTEAGGGARPGLMLDVNECLDAASRPSGTSANSSAPWTSPGSRSPSGGGTPRARRGRARDPGLGRHRGEPHRAGAVPPAAGGGGGGHRPERLRCGE